MQFVPVRFVIIDVMFMEIFRRKILFRDGMIMYEDNIICQQNPGVEIMENALDGKVSKYKNQVFDYSFWIF